MKLYFAFFSFYSFFLIRQKRQSNHFGKSHKKRGKPKILHPKVSAHPYSPSPAFAHSKGRAFTLPPRHPVPFLLKILVPCNTRYVLKISLAICTFPTTAPKSMSVMLGSWNNEGLRGLFFLFVFIHSWWYCSNAAGSLLSCRLETLFCLSHCINSGVERSWLVIDCCFLKDVPPFPLWSTRAEGTWLLLNRYTKSTICHSNYVCLYGCLPKKCSMMIYPGGLPEIESDTLTGCRHKKWMLPQPCLLYVDWDLINYFCPL